MSPLEYISSISELGEADLAIAAARARSARDPGTMIAVGGEYERRGCFDKAWSLLAEGAEAKRRSAVPQWRGQSMPDATLLVRRKMRHLGAELRMVRFVVPAATAFRKLIVMTEPRLVAILRRTFPEVTVIADDGEQPETDVEASYERLAMFCGASARHISGAFRALVPPDPVEWAPPNAIGIAWHSSNGRKHLPRLADWSAALGPRDLAVASLQYDEHQAGLETLTAQLGRRIAPSAPVDQMVDLDGFFRQVAAMSGVLTISNTTAHVAGMLGVPCVVILDDFQHLTWPRDADRSPFYPNLVTIRQAGRPWVEVIDAAIDRLLTLPAKPETLR